MGDINVRTTDTKRNDIFANRPDDDGATLTPDDVEELVDNVPAPKLRNELLLRLMYQCMLRRGEAARIRLENVDRDKRSVFIPAEDSKTGDEHTAYYNASLDFLMNQWIDADRESSLYSDSPYLFVSQRNERLSDFTVSSLVRRSAENAGIQETLYTDANGRDISRITGHSLRRAGATRRWNNGADIYTVKELLNHSSVETTKRYLRLQDDDLAEKARQSW
jgi:integrase/recombinase XerD